MKKYALCLAMLLSLAALLPAQGAVRERRIALSEYADKVRAAWLGKMAGVGWGITTEFRYSHRLVPDSMMQPWRPEMSTRGTTKTTSTCRCSRSNCSGSTARRLPPGRLVSNG